MNKLRIISIIALFLLLSSKVVFAAELRISGMDIPLIPGAVSAQEINSGSSNDRIANFVVDKPIAEAIAFYEAYLKENDFIVIGGKDGGGFHASIKKGDVLFILRIYAKGNQVILQFVW